MNIKEFNNLIADKKRELDNLMRNKLPIKVGATAKGFYQDNIAQRQGFLDGELTSWPKTRRQLSGGKSAASNYGALLSSRNHLFNSILYTPGEYRVRISNSVSYAPLHNNGGTVSPNITPKMRKYFWAKYYQSVGKVTKNKQGAWHINQSNKQMGNEASFYKAMALTKKTKLNIRIPQRQFLGKSQELNEQIRTITETEIRKVINN